MPHAHLDWCRLMRNFHYLLFSKQMNPHMLRKYKSIEIIWGWWMIHNYSALHSIHFYRMLTNFVTLQPHVSICFSRILFETQNSEVHQLEVHRNWIQNKHSVKPIAIITAAIFYFFIFWVCLYHLRTSRNGTFCCIFFAKLLKCIHIGRGTSVVYGHDINWKK